MHCLGGPDGIILCFQHAVSNMQYPAKEKKNMFTFIEATQLQNVDGAKKRVAINKLLQEMEISL